MLIILTGQIIGGSRTAVAQSQFLSIAPARYIASTQVAGGGEIIDFSAGFERAIPVANLLPQVSADSHVEFLRVLAGIRRGEDGPVTFRGRFTAVDLELQKQPWAASFSFLDVNASDVMELAANWIGLGVGSGFDVGDSSVRLLARGLVTGAFTTSKFGHELFPEAGPAVNNTRHTASFGAKGVVGLVIPKRARLLLIYALNRYAIDAGIQHTSWYLTGTINLSRKIQFLTSYRVDTVELDALKDDAGAVGFGFTYTPADTY